MLENAVRICDAKFGNIYRWDGEALHLLAAHDTPAALVEVRRRSALRPIGLYVKWWRQGRWLTLPILQQARITSNVIQQPSRQWN